MAGDRAPPSIVAAVATMLTTYALVILASLTLPVIAPLAADTLGVPAHYVGFYTSFVYVGAATASLVAPHLIARYGALRTSQGTLLCAAAGLIALAAGHVGLAVISALLVGFAYGPGNTASNRLLTAMTAPGRRSAVFSIKQTSVPIGGALAGAIVPPAAVLFGWQGAVLAVGAACLAMAAAVQPWRAGLDADRVPGHPLVPSNLLAPVLMVLRHARLRVLGLTGLVYSGMQYAFSAVMVAFLVERAGVSAVAGGLVLSAAMTTSVFARLAWGYVADRTRPDTVMALLGVLTAGSAAAAIFVTPDWPRAALVALGCWFGAAGFSWNGVFLALVADEAGEEKVAGATSGAMSLVFVGSLSFPALFTGLVAAFGYAAALLTIAACTLAASVYVWLALRQPAAG